MGLFKGSTMTLDNPNLITYGMNNSYMDYHYYQSIVSEQQQQQQNKLQNKSVYQASTNNNVRKQPSPIENLSQQKPALTQHLRPERPKTLDTQSTIGNTATNSKKMPFDEREEWKKITEIMANFGTDSDIFEELNDSNSHHLHFRSENGRSNSIAGLTIAQIDPQRNVLKKMDSMKQSIQRKSETQSPHSKLINFLCEHEIVELAETLMDNGYDDIEFVRGILDESDLDAMEVKPELRIKLMKAIDSYLHTPARAITTFTISHKHEDKTIFNNTLGTNKDELHQNEPNAIADNCENNSNCNNNNYSTIPKQQCHNSHRTDGSLSVNDWLNSIRLPHYAELFRKHLYNDMDRISRIWEIELQAVLEINKIGHRKRILYSVGAAPIKDQQILKKLSKNTQGKANMENASHRSLISISSLDSNNTNTSDGGTERKHRPNHRQNRQASNPPKENDIKLLAETATNLEIRAPSELLLDFPTGLRTQWRHSAELLIAGAVKYEVNYLGSTIVKELRGTESTKKSIQKLKKTDHLMGLNSTKLTIGSHTAERAVCIIISYRGVQFVDPQTKVTICEHEIRNINCACQDADDLSHFAYITKDSDAHYCHVFNVASMDLATEIILTLGQAFEVAYQIALRKSRPTTPSKSPINNLSDGQTQRI